MTDQEELAAIGARDALRAKDISYDLAANDRRTLLRMLREAVAARDAVRADNERLRESLLNISTVEITDYLPAARALTYCREVAKAALSHGQPPSDTP